MKKTLFILILLYSNILFSQKNYLSGSIFGSTPIVGAIYERTYMKELIGLEYGLGVISGSFGIKCYPKKIENNWTPYLGASHYLYIIPSNAGWKTYFPFGLTHLTKDGNRFSIDLGPNINWYDNHGKITPNFNIKIGFLL